MSTLADLPPSAKILVGRNGQFRFAMNGDAVNQRLAFKVTWEDSPAFLQAVIGTTATVNGLVRRIPLQNPYLSQLYAIGISDCQGQGSDENISDTRPYPWLIYTVDFAILPYGVSGDSAFLTLTHDDAGRTVTVPGQNYTFADDGSKIDQNVGLPIGGTAVQFTLHQLPSLPGFLSVVLPLVGKVNSTAVTVAGVTYPAGTLYFETFGTGSQRSAFGVETHEGSISLVYSALPWNQAIKPTTGLPANVSPAPFQVANLNALVM
jgi:hypothetical protein